MRSTLNSVYYTISGPEKNDSTVTPDFIYNVVDAEYEGLIRLDGNELRLVDDTFYDQALYYIYSSMINRIELIGKDFFISLSVLDSYQSGTLCMDYDMNISLKSCVALYDKGINIGYNDKLLGGKFIYYDKEVITRRNTIHNIINED